MRRLIMSRLIWIYAVFKKPVIIARGSERVKDKYGKVLKCPILKVNYNIYSKYSGKESGIWSRVYTATYPVVFDKPNDGEIDLFKF